MKNFIKRLKDIKAQALIELVGVILVMLMLGFGSMEGGIIYYNILTLNQAIENAAFIAAGGAEDNQIKELIYNESYNIITTPWIQHKLDNRGVIIEVWLDENTPIAPTASLWNQLQPKSKYRAEYLFRAYGYIIKVGVIYTIGIYIPFIDNVSVKVPIVGSYRIYAPNDLDRDGMSDIYEEEYFRGVLGSSNWAPFSHLNNNSMADKYNDDKDGDGILDSDGTDTLVYDFDNDGIDDKYDSGDNQMNHPILSP